MIAENRWLEYEREKAAFRRVWPECPPEVYEAFIRDLTRRLGL